MANKPVAIPAAPTAAVTNFKGKNDQFGQPTHHTRLAVVDSTKETLVLVNPATGDQYELMRADATNAGGADGTITTATEVVTVVNGIITAIAAP